MGAQQHTHEADYSFNPKSKTRQKLKQNGLQEDGGHQLSYFWAGKLQYTTHRTWLCSCGKASRATHAMVPRTFGQMKWWLGVLWGV